MAGDEFRGVFHRVGFEVDDFHARHRACGVAVEVEAVDDAC